MTGYLKSKRNKKAVKSSPVGKKKPKFSKKNKTGGYKHVASSGGSL